MALGESHPEPLTSSRCSVFGGNIERVGVTGTMVQEMKSGVYLPRVIIFSESGPLAGDLVACLSGRFAVEWVNSRAGADKALDCPADALLVVPCLGDQVGAEYNTLFRQALTGDCRVLLLGGSAPRLDKDLKGKIVELTKFPDPVLLFEELSDLPRGERAKES